MFDPRKPIQTTQDNIDKIVAIKRKIANEDNGTMTRQERDDLFAKYVKKDTVLNKITN